MSGESTRVPLESNDRRVKHPFQATTVDRLARGDFGIGDELTITKINAVEVCFRRKNEETEYQTTRYQFERDTW